ncbi:MAG: DUF1349 domain-containing protein [Eubacteriales bacterium]|nr:DUF1349 domain-containing protein [Eubacteriales bacterium]
MELKKTIANSIYEEIEKGIKAFALPNTDYFVNPESDAVVANAPFFYKEVTGDFVLRSKVSLDFKSTYDACVLLALDNERLWAKACFEMSDYGIPTVVTVMTNGRSDDANCTSIDGNEVWLQLSRKGNTFAVHYSLDGVLFQMARLTYLPMANTIKVGFVAQSPMGIGGERVFNNVDLMNVSLTDIRNGNI